MAQPIKPVRSMARFDEPHARPLPSVTRWRDGVRGLKWGMRRHSFFSVLCFFSAMIFTAAIVLGCSVVEWCLLVVAQGGVLSGIIFLSALEALQQELDAAIPGITRRAVSIATGGVYLLAGMAGIVVVLILGSSLFVKLG